MTEPCFINVHDLPPYAQQAVLQAAPGQDIILMDGSVPRARVVPIAKGSSQRIPGLHAGAMTMSDDFDSPLPDAYWVGEE